jgi:hypothetical protein
MKMSGEPEIWTPTILPKIRESRGFNAEASWSAGGAALDLTHVGREGYLSDGWNTRA